MARAPGNSKYVRKINRMSVLNIIKEQEPISRRQLADITGLTPPAITGIIREFLEYGLVEEEGLGLSGGGRKPVKLRFNPAAGYVAGVEVTRYESVLCMADLKNHPTGIIRIPIDMTNPATGIPHLLEALQEMMATGEREGKRFLGMGVAFPGLINTKEGSVIRSINLGPDWRNFPLRETLRSLTGLATVIENNSNASALAERWFGGGQDSADLVYVNLGEGISAGVMMDDRILQGFQGHAGEIGHIVMDESGPMCNCGNRGCLEAICGLPALLKQAHSLAASGEADDPLSLILHESGKITLADLINCARMKTSCAWSLLQNTGRFVGLAVADVINLYNPRTIFVGGRVASAAPIFLEVLTETAQSHAFPEMAQATEIRISSLGNDAGVIGACALALQNVLESFHSPLLATTSASMADHLAESDGRRSL